MKTSVHHRGDDSVIIRITDDLAYEVYSDGTLVAIEKKGSVTYFYEWFASDLTSHMPDGAEVTPSAT